VAPSLQAKQRTLKFNLARANLHHGLENRPSLKEIADKGILTQEDLEAADAGEAVRACAAYVCASGGGSSRRTRTQAAKKEETPEPAVYQRRSKNFHLTRILLKSVAAMSEVRPVRLVCAHMCALASRLRRTAQAGEISLQQKGFLKDLIVDQDPVVLRIAEVFDADNNYAAVRTHARTSAAELRGMTGACAFTRAQFKEHLMRLFLSK
jgi:hypothetical protein